jgi:hypothetical protein
VLGLLIVGAIAEGGKPPPRQSLAGGCDPHYVSKTCVPIAEDVDCTPGSGNGPAYVSGPFEYTGEDIYGLDRDHNGIACEPPRHR